MKGNEQIVITNKQWNNLKKIATKLDEIAEKLENCEFGIDIYDELNEYSNNLWKQINQIDGIKW